MNLKSHQHGKNQSGYSKGSLMVLLAASLWGTAGTSQALTPDSSTPETIAALRLIIAGTAMLSMAQTPRSLLTGWPWGKTLLAAALIAVYQYSSFSAMSATGVAVGTIVAMGTAPVFAGLLELIVNGKKPVPVWYLSTSLAILGCLFIVAPARGDLQINAHGIIFALMAGLSYAAYSVFISLLVKERSPQTVTAIVTCVGALFLLPFLFTANLSWLTEFNGWLAMLHLGLIATALSYWLFANGLKTTHISTAVTLTLAEPLVATLLGILVVGERVSGPVLCGIMVMFAALAMLIHPGRSKKKSPLSEDKGDKRD